MEKPERDDVKKKCRSRLPRALTRRRVEIDAADGGGTWGPRAAQMDARFLGFVDRRWDKLPGLEVRVENSF